VIKARTVDYLIIGYGNTLRGDDGAGPRVAEAVAGWGLPNVRPKRWPARRSSSSWMHRSARPLAGRQRPSRLSLSLPMMSDL